MTDQWWYPAREPPERIPFRNKFDQARDPLTARNAIGAVDAKFVADAIAAGGGGGGGGAPTTAQYITAAADATLTAERVLTNTATVTWDFSTAGQAKANAAAGGGGNVSNSGTPTVGQYAKWVTATTIQGVAPATVLSDIGAQPAGSYVPTTRTITAGAGLFGGGDLSADRIIDVGSGEGIQTGANNVNLDFNGLVEMTLPPDPGDFLCAYHLVATAHRKIKVSTLGFQPLDATLTALAAYNTNGLLTQTAADTFTGRSIAVPAAGISITNANGVSGNPTLALANDLAALEALAGTNTIYYRSGADAWTAVTVGTGLTFTTGTLDRAALTGDVTASAGANATTIANDAVTYAKMQNASAASVLIGRGSAAGAGDPQEITLGTGLSMTGTVLAATGGAGTSDPTPPQGRLTLVTATPVMTTTQAAKTTIFYTPYVGNKVPIYDGSNMVMTTFAELSNVTTASSTGKAGPAAVAASSVYDLFVWSDAGTVRLTRGPLWTNDTTRSAGTALVMVNGILLNNATITNGPAASRGTYVGTVRSNGSSQIDWIYGGIGVGGVAAFLGVWNTYNRCVVSTFIGDSTDSWTYALAAWRAANGSATMRAQFISGLAEDCFNALYVSSVTSGSISIGVGLNSTTAFSGSTGYASTTAGNYVSMVGGASMTYLGFGYVSALEQNSGGTTTLYGDAGGPTTMQTGLQFSFMM